jgi:hypothetical protein
MVVVMVRRRAKATVSDTDRILSSLDGHMRDVDTGRRADMLVSLPAMLAALVPMLSPVMVPYMVALTVQCFLITPVVVKIAKHL